MPGEVVAYGLVSAVVVNDNVPVKAPGVRISKGRVAVSKPAPVPTNSASSTVSPTAYPLLAAPNTVPLPPIVTVGAAL